jgi:hypothetical protein
LGSKSVDNSLERSRKMRRQAILVLAVVAVLASSLSICQGEMLGVFNWSKTGSGMGIIQSYEFYVLPVTASGPGLMWMIDDISWQVAPPDVGTTFVASSATHTDFDYIASILTGDLNGGARFWVQDLPHPLGASGTGGQDLGLIGAILERIELSINDMSIVSPGMDLNGDGNWTDESWDVTFRFFGTPSDAGSEPSVVPAPGAIVLASIGLSFSGWFLRRRRASH